MPQFVKNTKWHSFHLPNHVLDSAPVLHAASLPENSNWGTWYWFQPWDTSFLTTMWHGCELADRVRHEPTHECCWVRVHGHMRNFSQLEDFKTTAEVLVCVLSEWCAYTSPSCTAVLLGLRFDIVRTPVDVRTLESPILWHCDTENLLGEFVSLSSRSCCFVQVNCCCATHSCNDKWAPNVSKHLWKTQTPRWQTCSCIQTRCNKSGQAHKQLDTSEHISDSTRAHASPRNPKDSILPSWHLPYSHQTHQRDQPLLSRKRLSLENARSYLAASSFSAPRDALSPALEGLPWPCQHSASLATALARLHLTEHCSTRLNNSRQPSRHKDITEPLAHIMKNTDQWRHFGTWNPPDVPYKQRWWLVFVMVSNHAVVNCLFSVVCQHLRLSPAFEVAVIRCAVCLWPRKAHVSTPSTWSSWVFCAEHGDADLAIVGRLWALSCGSYSSTKGRAEPRRPTAWTNSPRRNRSKPVDPLRRTPLSRSCKSLETSPPGWKWLHLLGKLRRTYSFPMWRQQRWNVVSTTCMRNVACQ